MFPEPTIWRIRPLVLGGGGHTVLSGEYEKTGRQGVADECEAPAVIANQTPPNSTQS